MKQANICFLESFKNDFDSLYACYNLPVREDIERALDNIIEFIQEEGPFDGVIGFSQGGLVASALLLRDAARPEGPQLPFQMAVLVSAFTPHNVDSQSIEWNLNDN